MPIKFFDWKFLSLIEKREGNYSLFLPRSKEGIISFGRERKTFPIS
jgi:hypothetical protein